MKIPRHLAGERSTGLLLFNVAAVLVWLLVEFFMSNFYPGSHEGLTHAAWVRLSLIRFVALVLTSVIYSFIVLLINKFATQNWSDGSGPVVARWVFLADLIVFTIAAAALSIMFYVSFVDDAASVSG